jgi:hypothetical protein
LISTWTMTRRARAQAAEQAVTRVEIAAAIADPDVDVALAEDPSLRCVGRAGLYVVIDPVVHTVVTVTEQTRRTPRPAPDADPTVKIRRRPVADRPHHDVPAALLAAPAAPVASFRFGTPAEPVGAVEVEPVAVLPSVLNGTLDRRKQTTPAPTLRVGFDVAPSAPVASPRLGTSSQPDPVLPSVLNGTLAPRKRTTPPPAPRARAKETPVPRKDKLAGVHPGIAAGVRAELARRGLDESRVVVHSPTNVEIR